VTCAGALARFTRWSDEEDQVLAEAYARGGIYAAREALPHRTERAIFKRAGRAGLKRRPLWTPVEDERLRLLWGDGLTLATIASRIGRPQAGVYLRAQQLGLTSAAPQGFEYLWDAARRVGFSKETLVRILRAGGKTIYPAPSRPLGREAAFHRRIVQPTDVDDAVAAWLKTERANTAARRLGIDGQALRNRLARLGLATSRAAHLRLTDEQLDQANAIAQWSKGWRRTRAGRAA
jgi:hypothetical protein